MAVWIRETVTEGAQMRQFDVRAEEFGDLQRVVDALFADAAPGVDVRVGKLDVVAKADVFDLCADLREIVELLPSRSFDRKRLCDQLNSSLTGHGWGALYGTVE